MIVCGIQTKRNKSVLNSLCFLVFKNLELSKNELKTTVCKGDVCVSLKFSAHK